MSLPGNDVIGDAALGQQCVGGDGFAVDGDGFKQGDDGFDFVGALPSAKNGGGDGKNRWQAMSPPLGTARIWRPCKNGSVKALWIHKGF